MAEIKGIGFKNHSIAFLSDTNEVVSVKTEQRIIIIISCHAKTKPDVTPSMVTPGSGNPLIGVPAIVNERMQKTIAIKNMKYLSSEIISPIGNLDMQRINSNIIDKVVRYNTSEVQLMAILNKSIQTIFIRESILCNIEFL